MSFIAKNDITDQDECADIVMSIRSDSNLSLLKSLLDGHHNIHTGRDHFSDADLHILDYVSFCEQEDELRSLKKRSQLFTPVIVLTQNISSLKMKQSLWKLADDVLPMPMPRQLLLSRTQVLLRTRKYSKELQKKNEELELYKKAIDSTNSGIVITNAGEEDNPIIFCNRGFEELTGYREDEILGKNCRFLQNNDQSQKAVSKIRKAINRGESCSVTIRNYKKDGELFWNELNIAPIQNNRGEITHFVGIQNDLTGILEIQEQLRESQKRWEQLVTKNPALVLIFTDDRVCYINPAGARFLGAEDNEKLVGKRVSNLISVDNQEKMKSRVSDLMNNKEVNPTTYKITTLSGDIRYVEIQSTKIHYRGEDAIQTVGLDVTQRVKYEQKIHRSLEEKQTLLQEIHHRVKNNLAIVSGLLELQRMEIDDTRLKKVLIDNQSRIMSIAKVHEMLYQNEHLSRINFDGYVRELIATLKNTYRNDFIDLSFELDLHPVSLNIDQAVPCGLIINELLTNAIKHAFPNQSHGTISVKLESLSDEEIKLSISDDGVGVDSSFELEDQKTLGSTIIKLLITQLHAEYSHKTANGTLFEIIFKKTSYTGPSKKLSDDVT